MLAALLHRNVGTMGCTSPSQVQAPVPSSHDQRGVIDPGPGVVAASLSLERLHNDTTSADRANLDHDARLRGSDDKDRGSEEEDDEGKKVGNAAGGDILKRELGEAAKNIAKKLAAVGENSEEKEEHCAPAFTSLSVPAKSGDAEIQAVTSAGFSIGDKIIIGDHDEAGTVAGIGPFCLTLKDQLQKNHPLGSIVAKQDDLPEGAYRRPKPTDDMGWLTVHVVRDVDGGALTASFTDLGGETLCQPQHFKMDDNIAAIRDYLHDQLWHTNCFELVFKFYDGSNTVPVDRDMANYDILTAAVEEYAHLQAFDTMLVSLLASVSEDGLQAKYIGEIGSHAHGFESVVYGNGPLVQLAGGAYFEVRVDKVQSGPSHGLLGR